MRRIAPLGKDDQVEFKDIGMKIAKKCNGLPLAAMTLGSVLRNKSTLEEWKIVLNDDVWKMKEAEVELFPHLLLSYNELSPTLKRCFSYCVVYPKDSNIRVDELIGNWMTLGYLGNDSTAIEDRGREYFDILRIHSLFQEIFIDEYDGEICCTVHDIVFVHDFTLFLRKNSRAGTTTTNKCTTCRDRDPSPISSVNEFKSLFWINKESPPNSGDCLTRLRVLSLRLCNFQGIPQIMENFIHLRSLNLNGYEPTCDDLKIIFKLYNLKTLNLGNCGLAEIPTEIEHLIHLRSLNLCRNGLSRDSLKVIFKLYNLKTLNLGNCNLTEILTEIEKLIHLRNLNFSFNPRLKKLPETICGLHELQILNVEECIWLDTFPEGLAQLTSLSSLVEFKGTSTWSELGLLKNFSHFGGYVSLIIKLDCDNDLESVVKDARETELKNKMRIERLEIELRMR